MQLNNQQFCCVTKHVHYLEATLPIHCHSDFSSYINLIHGQTKLKSVTCVHILLPGVTQPSLQMVVDWGTFLWLFQPFPIICHPQLLMPLTVTFVCHSVSVQPATNKLYSSNNWPWVCSRSVIISDHPKRTAVVCNQITLWCQALTRIFKALIRLCDTNKEQLFKNHQLVSQVQGDLTDIIFTFEDESRQLQVSIAYPTYFGYFGHMTTFWIFMNIKTMLISHIERSSMINQQLIASYQGSVCVKIDRNSKGSICYFDWKPYLYIIISNFVKL